MGQLAQYAEQELIWTSSTTARRTYELRAGDQVLATLKQPSVWRQERVATVGASQWRFASHGAFRPVLVVSDTQTGAEIGQMKRSSWKKGGALALAGGGRYTWRGEGTWRTRWFWLDVNDQPLLRFRQEGMLHLRCVIAIEPAAATLIDLPLLAALGWHLILLTNAETAAIAATTAAAATTVMLIL